MRISALATLFALSLARPCLAQSEGALRIAEVLPYDRAVPGQIVELSVDGFTERLISPPPGDALKILLTQDGSTLTARARTAAPTLVRVSPPASGGGAPSD